MTDISTDPQIHFDPIAVRSTVLARLSLRGPQASLIAMARLVGDAFRMAYVDPYVSHGRQPKIAPDKDFEGRDPTW